MNKILAILFLLLPFCTLGQQTNKSKSQLEADAASDKKIHKLLQRSTFYGTTQLDSSLFFTNKAMELSKQLGNDSIDATIRAHKAGILIRLTRFDEAEKLLFQNIENPDIAKSILGSTYNNLGTSYNMKEEFDKATVNYLKAVEIFELFKDSTMLGKTFANLGVIHARLKDYKKAISFMDKGMAFVGKNELLKMQLTLNLSAVYYEEKQIDKAISTSHEAEKLANQNNANSVLATVYSNLCRFYLAKKEFDTSIKYGLDALELKQSMNQDDSIVLNNLGYAYLQNGDDTKALHYLNRALPTAMGEAKSLIYNNLSQTLQNMGNYRQAVTFANKHIQLKDSLNLLAQQKNVSELIEKYESEKKQQQLDLLNTKNELNQNKISNQRNFIWAMALFSLFMLFIGFLLVRNHKTTQSLKAAKIQHRLLQTQLNPHFLFNALNSIQAFGYSNNREKLSDYVDSFSKLMRSILESSDQDFITVKEDSQTLKEYLYLQKSSTEHVFETRITIDPDIDPQVLIPPMFTQPFVENSVLHGVKTRKDGLIEVHYSEENNCLQVQIEDNGSGVSTDPDNYNKLHRSMGMDIMNDRVANLQKTNNYKCSIEINSGKSGTTVLLTFPIRYKNLAQNMKNG
jgi:tetratricopeptide (TPR) repeat protein